MEQSFYSALQQAEEILKDVRWQDYEDILFISKSVGTIVAACYKQKYQIKARSISFTPLEDTFSFASGEGIMFHGTADPWVKDSKKIYEGCEKIGQPLYVIENANHSLETGDVAEDLVNLAKIMRWVEEYIWFWRWLDIQHYSIKDQWSRGEFWAAHSQIQGHIQQYPDYDEEECDYE